MRVLSKSTDRLLHQHRRQGRKADVHKSSIDSDQASCRYQGQLFRLRRPRWPWIGDIRPLRLLQSDEPFRPGREKVQRSGNEADRFRRSSTRLGHGAGFQATFAEDPPSPKTMPRGAQFKPTAARSVAPAIGGRRGPPKFPDHSDLALPGIEWQSALKYRRVP